MIFQNGNKFRLIAVPGKSTDENPVGPLNDGRGNFPGKRTRGAVDQCIQRKGQGRSRRDGGDAGLRKR